MTDQPSTQASDYAMQAFMTKDTAERMRLLALAAFFRSMQIVGTPA